MRKGPFIIVPAILIIHSVVLSLWALYSGPSRYSSVGFSAVWPNLITLLGGVLIAVSLKSRYWTISIIALALAGFPRSQIATFPEYSHVLVGVTLILDLVSAATLILANAHDTFDFSHRGSRHTSGIAYLLILMVSLIIAGIFLYFGMP